MRKMGMSEKRFTWKTEKLQHFDDEVIMVVDNANKDWKGHILNIVDLLNEQQSTIEQLEKKLELKTEEVEYLKRMMVKWGMVKDE